MVLLPCSNDYNIQTLRLVLGDGAYFLNVGLVDGVVYLNVYMGGGSQPAFKLIGTGTRFDDNHWHHVVIKRIQSDVSVLDFALPFNT